MPKGLQAEGGWEKGENQLKEEPQICTLPGPQGTFGPLPELLGQGKCVEGGLPH